MSVSRSSRKTPIGDQSVKTTVPTGEESKARKPPSLKEKQKQGKAKTVPPPQQERHTMPSLSSTAHRDHEERDGLQLIQDQFEVAIKDQNWVELCDLIDFYGKNDLTLLRLPGEEHPSIEQLRETSVIKVLTANETISDDQVSAALGLLNMGADWNAEDKNGNSVLQLLRKSLDREAIQFIEKEYPTFKHLFIDRDGKRIPAKS